jgi:hypothetical protein
VAIYAQTIDVRNISIITIAMSTPYIPNSYPTMTSFATSNPTTYGQGFGSSSFNNQTFNFMLWKLFNLWTSLVATVTCCTLGKKNAFP